MAKLPKPVLEVASDYMRSVFHHALKEIESESLDPSFLESFQKQFVLTVPAVWSDKAKNIFAVYASLKHIDSRKEK